MIADPMKIVAFCRTLEGMPQEDLASLDRQGLLLMIGEIKELRRELDRALLRLSFADEQRLN